MSQPICSKCGRPKESQASASLTQWFAVCTCDVQEPEAIREVRLCTTCGKRINEGRSGSFTQWIFRSDVCSCKQSLYASGASPAQQESTHIDFSAPSEPSIEDDEEMLVNEDIAIDAGTFPSDRYKPLTLLGCGVAGTVYLCQDKILSKKVAVKTLRERSNKQLIALQNEARACSKLKHKNIVQVLDFGVTDGGIPYMVMQYVRGESLESIKRRLRALEWRPLIMMIVELCKALAYLHENQIFHRDLKPSNILVRDANEEPPQVWLIDFGISIQAGEGNSTATLAGTPAYMSPDHAAGRAYTAASDIYSLGCILFS